MKKPLIALFTACIVAVAAVGCKKATKVDTAKLEAEFASAPADAKAEADKAVAAIKAGNFIGAVRALDNVMAKSNDLSQAQLTAAQEAFVLANVAVSETGGKAAADEAKAKAAEVEAQAKGAQ